MNKTKSHIRNFKDTGMSIPLKSHETLSKKSKVVFGKETESNISKRIREQNDRIVEELQLIRNGPFGLLKLFRRCVK